MKLSKIPNYLRYARNKLLKPKAQPLPASQRPVFWLGSGGCGFLRVYDILQNSQNKSVFFKSKNKLHNYNARAEIGSELVWERSPQERARVQSYFAKNGVYDHHIAPYTIRYAKEIIERFEGNTVLLCLKSAKSVEALWLGWGYRNPLTTDRARRNRFPVEFYPDLRSEAPDAKLATQKYYDLYYREAEVLQRAYPENFCIVDADKFFSDKPYFDSINERFKLGLAFKQSQPDCDKKTITTSLHGGLGNNLFQMAEPVAFCSQYNLPAPVFSTWDMPEFPPAYRADLFIGGHSGQPEELTRTFPHIKWLPPTHATFDDKFMLSDMYAFADVHAQREAILKYFEPSQEVKDYILQKYPAIAGAKTLSLHHRAGWLSVDTHTFKAFGEDWYKDVFKEHFAQGYDVFVFSDKLERGKELMEKIEAATNNRFHLVDEGVFISLIMMSMCKNHLLSNSTLSFWGAYLDPLQPAGKTILHSSFVSYHSEPHIECRMIPYKEWELL